MIEQVPTELLEILLEEPSENNTGTVVDAWVKRVSDRFHHIDISQMILNLDREIAWLEEKDGLLMHEVYALKTMMVSRQRLRQAWSSSGGVFD